MLTAGWVADKPGVDPGVDRPCPESKCQMRKQRVSRSISLVSSKKVLSVFASGNDLLLFHAAGAVSGNELVQVVAVWTIAAEPVWKNGAGHPNRDCIPLPAELGRALRIEMKETEVILVWLSLALVTAFTRGFCTAPMLALKR